MRMSLRVADILNTAKCGTVILELPSVAAAQEMYDQLQDGLEDLNSAAVICRIERKVVINPN